MLYESAIGATSFTVTETPNETDPPELVAVTVYVAVAETTLGVPEIIPVVVSSDNPLGKVGETLYETTFPVMVGLSDAIAEPIV